MGGASYDDMQRYNNITFFIFAVFDVRTSVAVNMCNVTQRRRTSVGYLDYFCPRLNVRVKH